MRVELNQTDINALVARLFAVETPLQRVTLTDNNIIAVNITIHLFIANISPTLNFKVTSVNGKLAFHIENFHHIPFSGKVLDFIVVFLNKFPWIQKNGSSFVINHNDIPNIEFFRKCDVFFDSVKVSRGQVLIDMRFV